MPNKYKSKELMFSKQVDSSVLANLSDSTLGSYNESVCDVSEIEPYAQ